MVACTAILDRNDKFEHDGIPLLVSPSSLFVSACFSFSLLSFPLSSSVTASPPLRRLKRIKDTKVNIYDSVNAITQNLIYVAPLFASFIKPAITRRTCFGYLHRPRFSVADTTSSPCRLRATYRCAGIDISRTNGSVVYIGGGRRATKIEKIYCI